MIVSIDRIAIGRGTATGEGSRSTLRAKYGALRRAHIIVITAANLLLLRYNDGAGTGLALV